MIPVRQNTLRSYRPSYLPDGVTVPSKSNSCSSPAIKPPPITRAPISFWPFASSACKIITGVFLVPSLCQAYCGITIESGFPIALSPSAATNTALPDSKSVFVAARPTKKPSLGSAGHETGCADAIATKIPNKAVKRSFRINSNNDYADCGNECYSQRAQVFNYTPQRNSPFHQTPSSCR